MFEINKSQDMKQGLTLVELMITTLMFVVLTGVTICVFRAVLLGGFSQETRTGINISLGSGIEKMERDLREAIAVQSITDYDEIRFILQRRDENNRIIKNEYDYYIYYLYNVNDSYVPPPAFSEDSYELRKAALADDINGTFGYGSGQIIITDILPPPTTDLSVSGGIVTIDLSVKRGDETIRSRTELKPRNL